MSFEIAPMGFSVDFKTTDGVVYVGPHKFVAIGVFRNGGKCRACYLPMIEHPTKLWAVARPKGDKR